MTAVITSCQFCGKSHGLRCPEVKAVEYFDTGRLKRVEFITPFERFVTYAPQPTPLYPITFMPEVGPTS